MAMTSEQVAALAYQAGFRDRALLIAIALAQSESSNNPAAVNPTSGAAGLWQIKPSAHPEFDKAKLLDPAYNAMAAYQVAGSPGGTPGPKSFNPWEDYKNGKFRRYIGAAADAARTVEPAGQYEGSSGASPAGNPVAPVVTAAKETAKIVTEPLAVIGRFFAALINARLWFRVGLGALGVLLLVAGGFLLAKDVTLGGLGGKG